MTINKYQGKTEEEAKQKAREELGSACVIMNVKEIKAKGISGLFKSSTYEVTAAIEEDAIPRPKNVSTVKPVVSNNGSARNFDAVADEEISIDAINEANALKDAFNAVNKVLNKENEIKESVNPAPKPVAPEKEDDFEPLSSGVPKIQLIDATYQKPKTAVAPTKAQEAQRALEERLSAKSRPRFEEKTGASIDNDNHVFVKMLYNVLLDNEVQEKYINQVLEDMDRILQTSHSLDNLLSSVYQKMVLKLGTPSTIKMGTKRPKIVFFIGPTGVGKTTTIAKIASKFKVEEGKNVGLITADTYRMAAADQLRTYANILDVPMNVIYSGEDLNEAVKKQTREYENLDVILVDTIGFSHKNEVQRKDMKNLLEALDNAYEKEVFLVLSATTKYKDLIAITNSYMEFTKFGLIFTKLDETTCYGNIFNIKLHTGAPLSYVTTGQNVPDDIDVVNTQKLVKQLLGGN